MKTAVWLDTFYFFLLELMVWNVYTPTTDTLCELVVSGMPVNISRGEINIKHMNVV